MANNNNIGALSQLDPSLTSLPTKQEKARSNEEVSQDEFLQLLVTQLKNQDPLEPVKNEEFAVQLAQFSQLGELVKVNENLTKGSNDISSLAGYLGHDVVMNSNVIEVNGHNGGQISFNLADDAASVTVDLLTADGSVAESVELGPLSAGKNTVELSELATSSGNYAVQVSALSTNGAAFEAQANVSGTVSGFVPGPEPTLLVGNREISPADILEVQVASEG
jgi:flagellar basal-body rod modification protein FlgD